MQLPSSKSFLSTTSTIYFAPGRVNLIGEHVDYNGGHVLPFALDRGICLSITQAGNWRFSSEQFIDVFETVRLEDFKIRKHKWYDFILGVVHWFYAKGYKIPTFHITVSSNLPAGAGLSSSAALSVAAVMAMGDLLGLNFEENEIAIIAQQVENDYVGVSCGIMDQIVSAYGRKDKVLLLNCQTLKKEFIPLNFNDYELIISHSGKSRILSDSWFNVRQQECQTALQFAQKFYAIEALCQLDSVELFFDVHEPWAKRAIHVIEENARVVEAAKFLKSNDLQSLAFNMNQSHDSLKANYEVTGYELDTIVAEARKIEGVLAARMSGAGFGGCSINLVHRDAVEGFYTKLRAAYIPLTGLPIEFYRAVAGAGAQKQEL